MLALLALLSLHSVLLSLGGGGGPCLVQLWHGWVLWPLAQC